MTHPFSTHTSSQTSDNGTTIISGTNSDSSNSSSSSSNTIAIVIGVIGLIALISLTWGIMRWRRNRYNNAFDGNFDPDKMTKRPEGGVVGGTLPNVSVDDDHLNPLMSQLDDNGMGDRLNASIVGGIVAPYQPHHPSSTSPTFPTFPVPSILLDLHLPFLRPLGFSLVIV
ncbi:hypothetical protein K435DRAFT_876569 [Dendrothele bispora CBS 962.96]|uniref:Uncharacterized protein n=1 Tax=Dendrothele bispora (strain CBS 962.96) TaxID=1314807 RepID=A0A4S8KRS7_DENBC|nr:hypothetical protein K435DRAFT_876569 [Dendrothele bispora CBS 962.96]